jgi:hypothetical protein
MTTPKIENLSEKSFYAFVPITKDYVILSVNFSYEEWLKCRLMRWIPARRHIKDSLEGRSIEIYELFFKKRLSGVGSKPGSSRFHLFSHFHHFTAEPQRLTPTMNLPFFTRKIVRFLVNSPSTS